MASNAFLFLTDTDYYYNVTDQWDSNIISWFTNGAPVGITATWPLARLGDALAVCCAYIAFVVLGRPIMKTLKIKMDLYPLLFGYNFLQMMLCSYMSIEALFLARRHNYNLLVPCNVVDLQNPKIADLLFIFYISKILDFVDTFAIIMRGKWNQLSFLHVYHHISIFLFYWLNLKTNYDGDIYLTILLNAFIHAIMYTYYFITMQIPKLAGGQSMFTLWWKKYTTQLQMVQFTLMVAQAVYLLWVDCPHYHLRIVKAYAVYICSLFALFINFYSKQYSSKPGRRKKKR